MNDTPEPPPNEAEARGTGPSPEPPAAAQESEAAPDEPTLPERDRLAVWALRDKVLFPQMLIPLSATRQMSLEAVEHTLSRDDKTLVVVLQQDDSVERPGEDDLHRVGTRAVIKRMERSDEGLQVLVQGVDRVGLVAIHPSTESALVEATVEALPAPSDEGPDIEALHRSVRERVQQIQKLADPQVAMALQQLLNTVSEPRRLAYLLTAALSLKADDEQDLLATDTRREALEKINEYLFHEVKVLELKSQIAGKVKADLTQRQREHVLREQMKAIQKELGEEDGTDAELVMLRQKLDEAELTDDVREELTRELSRLERTNPAAPDYQTGRGYVEFALELPWKEATEDQLDLTRAKETLDEDHYGLTEVKERILEHLAVLKLNPEARAPILCFLGPPGTGKTSLGRSIARSIGRKFERMALGGMHDESELRGHRRTYVGAMPGRILQAIRRAGVNNPLLMLDEVDKLGRDFRGDPAAALMEVLDPSQNGSFRDNYLNLPFDLSNVFFICTANTLDTLPMPLIDRMEIIEVDGYTDEEKLAIARRYLIPRRLKESGLSADQIDISDDVLLQVIRGYTMEAGLRQLERTLGKLSRKVAYRFAVDEKLGDTGTVVLTAPRVHEMLGPPWNRDERVRTRNPAGVVAGLAWTPTGGDVLYIEVARLPYNTGFTLTGQLGNVMKESAQAAMSYVLAMARTLEIPRHVIGESGIHIHVPQGAIPKDGPSAGITIATALASVYTGLPVRNDVAMTGEMTLTGLVLPIGGVRQKAMAAHRAGMKLIILPEDNRKDLHDVPDSVRDAVEFAFVSQIEEVWARAIPTLADRLQACRLDWIDPSDRDEATLVEMPAEPEEVGEAPASEAARQPE